MTHQAQKKWAVAVAALSLVLGLASCHKTDGNPSRASGVVAARPNAVENALLDGDASSYSIPSDQFAYWTSRARRLQPERINQWRALAGKGDSEAQLDLGVKAFLNKDYQQAAGWFRKAADKESMDAQYMLGVQYAVGLGAPRDYDKAVDWFRKAGERGMKNAQNDLGLLYKLGQGVPKNYQQSAAWFMRAAEQGFAPALTRKAAEQGLASAQYNLSVFLASGEGTERDRRQAAIWVRKAAEQGHAMAQHSIGWSYAKGIGTDKDMMQAYRWCSLAAPRIFDARQCVNAALSEMTPAQIEQGKMLVKGWTPQGHGRDE